MIDDPDRCYAAVTARDPRFDGWFFVGVTTTAIHCRPSCPARTPARANVRFFATSAAAQAAGFRACKRCRPDASPGSPAWDHRGDVVARAMRLIADGEVDRAGVAGLAARLGYSARHLHRQLVAEVGAGPRDLARIQRARTARTLVEATGLPFTEVAFAAGFGSVRQFNDTLRRRYDATPSQLRAAARRGRQAAAGETVRLRLACRTPFAGPALLAHLAARAIPGMEEVGLGWHRRALHLPHGSGVATLTPRTRAVEVDLDLDDPRDLPAAVARLRRLCDLDADPVAVDAHLAAHDPALARLVARVPGLRSPGAVDGTEAVLRAVLGQQVSLAGAATLAGRVVRRCGVPLTRPVGAVTHRLPAAEALAAADLTGLGAPRPRLATLQRLARHLADGTLDLGAGAERSAVRATLDGVPGVGPWTVELLAMRGLHDPDAFPVGDLVLRRAAGRLGLPVDPGMLRRHAQRWRPWRAYAAQHLWWHAATGHTDPLPDPAATRAATSRPRPPATSHPPGRVPGDAVAPGTVGARS